MVSVVVVVVVVIVVMIMLIVVVSVVARFMLVVLFHILQLATVFAAPRSWLGSWQWRCVGEWLVQLLSI